MLLCIDFLFLLGIYGQTVAYSPRQICLPGLEWAIDTFGRSLQTIVAIEELSELQKELCKVLRDNWNEEIEATVKNKKNK